MFHLFVADDRLRTLLSEVVNKGINDFGDDAIFLIIVVNTLYKIPTLFRGKLGKMLGRKSNGIAA